MNSYYIFVRVKKAIESRLFTLEHTFSDLVSRENVNIRLFFLQDPLFHQKNVLLQQKTKCIAMKKEELEKLVEKIAQRTANIVMEQLKGKSQVQIPGIDPDEYVDSKEAARMLGLTPNYLRTMKEKFPHIKVGENNQGRVLFKKSALLNSYKNK